MVTHPFHPLRGGQRELVACRHNWGEDRVLIRDRSGAERWLPAAWTDLVPPDPYVALSAGRSMFRVADLLSLAALVRGMAAANPPVAAGAGRSEV